jgi:nitrite reductase/ring-hydroxylating ferredoxin subunit
MYILSICMNQKNFLSNISAGALPSSDCLPLSPWDFTIDLNQYPQLTKSDGFLINANTRIALTTQGTFLAATVICGHEQQRKIIYGGNKQFPCTAHDARFDSKGLNGNGKKNLTVYQNFLEGNSLRINA